MILSTMSMTGGLNVGADAFSIAFATQSSDCVAQRRIRASRLLRRADQARRRRDLVDGQVGAVVFLPASRRSPAKFLIAP